VLFDTVDLLLHGLIEISLNLSLPCSFFLLPQFVVLLIFHCASVLDGLSLRCRFLVARQRWTRVVEPVHYRVKEAFLFSFFNLDRHRLEFLCHILQFLSSVWGFRLKFYCPVYLLHQEFFVVVG
jgi:hypothetical protein